MAETDAAKIHRSVLLEETVSYLKFEGRATVVDATLGMGGHTEAILERSPLTTVIGIDQDEQALEIASKRLERFGKRAILKRANFSRIKEVLKSEGITTVQGILADLGVSSLQFDSAERGFSFRNDAPLDMRMDAGSDAPTAAELLATLSEEEIADIIYRYGEERESRRIARRIVWKREIGEPIKTTFELAEAVEKAVRKSSDRIHPATKTFQALRIAVNHEIEILEDLITQAVEALSPNGILAVITFHSLEDRIVKQAFQRFAGKCICPPRMPVCGCGAVKKIEILTRKPVIAGERELAENPRARSAKLRAARKLS